MKKEHLKLTEDEYNYLLKLTTSGEIKARQFKRAMVLLLLNEGKTLSSVSNTLKYCYPRVLALRDNYLANGLSCLEEKSRSGRPPLLDDLAKAKITELASTNPPADRSQWSLRKLADKVVELQLAETISHNKVRQILKNELAIHFKEKC